MEEQFLLFMYDSYYPAGGMCDLKASFDTLIEVEEYLNENPRRYEHLDIYDRVNNVTVTLNNIKL